MSNWIGSFSAPPQDERLVVRPALSERLSSAHRILVLEAPGGFGKTVALSAWAYSSGALFLTLRREHEDARLLRQYVAAAIAHRLNDSHPEASETLLHFRAVVEGAEAAEGLMNPIGPLSISLNIAFDEVQFVRTDSEAAEFLDGLIQLGLEFGFRFALSGRSMPRLPVLNRLQTHPTLCRIGAAELTLSADEVAEVVERQFGFTPSPSLVKTIHDRTHGWPSLVALFGKWLSNQAAESRDHAASELTGSEKSIYAYLASEILDDRPELHRQFLLSASLADYLPVGLVDSLLPAAGLDIMREFEFGRFVTRHDLHGEPSYLLHPLLAEFLCARANEELGPLLVQRLHRTFADWFGRNRMWNAAFRHWLEASSPDQIVRQMLRWEMAFEEWWPDYGSWVTRLDRSSIATAPRIMIRHAMASANLGEIHEAMEWIEMAAKSASELDDDQARLDVETAKAIVLFFANFPEDSKRICDALEPGIESMTPFQRSTLATAIVLLHNNDYIDPAKSLRFLEIYEETVHRAGMVRGAFIATANRAVASRIIGDFEQQIGVIETLRRAGTHIPRFYEALLLFSEALAMLELGEPGAEETMVRAIDQLAMLGAKGQAEYGRNVLRHFRLESGLDACMESSPGWTSGNSPYKEESFAFESLGDARVAARMGDVESAMKHSMAAIESSRNLHLRAIALLESARTALDVGERKLGISWAEEALDAGKRVPMNSVAARARIVLAAVSPAPDRELLRDMLDDARRPRYESMFLNRERTFAERALNHALAQGIESEIASSLLAKLGSVPMRVHGFGGLRVLGGVGDEAVVWERPQAKALFAFLLLQAGRPVHAETIIEHFWPDSDAKSSRANLKTTVARIRKAMQAVRGPNVAIVNDDLYRLEDDDGVWKDWRAFESLTDAASDPYKSLGERVASGTAALKIADREFLPEFRFEEWAAVERERIGLRRQELMSTLGNSLNTMGRFEEARELGESMLDYDPFDESGAQVLVRALHGLGRSEEAKRVFRRFEKKLLSELGIEPSRELTTLAESTAHTEN